MTTCCNRNLDVCQQLDSLNLLYGLMEQGFQGNEHLALGLDNGIGN